MLLREGSGIRPKDLYSLYIHIILLLIYKTPLVQTAPTTFLLFGIDLLLAELLIAWRVSFVLCGRLSESMAC